MPLSGPQWLRRTALLAISTSLAIMISMVSGDPPTDGGDSATLSPMAVPPGSERPEITGPDRAADQRAARLKHSYDAGDFYYYRGERMPLLRSLTEFSVEFRDGTSEQRKQDIIDSAFFDARFVDAGRVRGRPVARVELGEVVSVEELQDVLMTMNAWTEVRYAFPALLHPQGGERFILTDEVVVRVNPGAMVEDVPNAQEQGCLGIAKKVWGTEDQYVLRVRQPKKNNPLQVANKLSESGVVAWAEPNFVQEGRLAYTPSDPLYPDQWPFNNRGHLESRLELRADRWGLDLDIDSPADADVDAPEAWDLDTGSADIVIAVIDSGMDIAHEDLVDNLFRNDGEIPGNGCNPSPAPLTGAKMVRK